MQLGLFVENGSLENHGTWPPYLCYSIFCLRLNESPDVHSTDGCSISLISRASPTFYLVRISSPLAYKSCIWPAGCAGRHGTTGPRSMRASRSCRTLPTLTLPCFSSIFSACLQSLPLVGRLRRPANDTPRGSNSSSFHIDTPHSASRISTPNLWLSI